MKTYKNVVAEKSEHLTTVFFCQTEGEAPKEFGEWVECDELDIDLAKYNDRLWTQAGVTYFGRL